MAKKYAPNKPTGIRLALQYASLSTNRQKEDWVMGAEQRIYTAYEYLLRCKKEQRQEQLRLIAKYVCFLYLVKGDDYCKTALYRVMIKLHTDGLIWISWKHSGHPKPKTAYFFVKRTIRKTLEPMHGRQMSYWQGEAILPQWRKYE